MADVLGVCYDRCFHNERIAGRQFNSWLPPYEAGLKVMGKQETGVDLRLLPGRERS